MSAWAADISPWRGGEQLGWGVALSLGAHLVLLAALVLWPASGPSRRQIFSPVYQVRLVGPPRLAPAPPAKAARPKPKPVARPKPVVKAKPAPRPKPAPKAKEAIATKPVKKLKRIKPKKRAATPPDTGKILDRRLKRLEAKVKQEERVESAISRLQRKVAARGNQRAGAFASRGAAARASQLSMRFQVYYTELWERIRRHWVLPEVLVKNPRGLVAVVVMRIRRDGSLEKVWLEQSSGNPRFDASALRAARQAAPYPPLPSGLRQSVHEVGVRFRPEDMG